MSLRTIFRHRLAAFYVKASQSQYRLWYRTGPTAVKEIAEAARRAGFKPVEGTEHVIVDVEGEDRMSAEMRFLEALRHTHGKTFGLGKAERAMRRA